jgi:hypothetical protein
LTVRDLDSSEVEIYYDFLLYVPSQLIKCLLVLRSGQGWSILITHYAVAAEERVVGMMEDWRFGHDFSVSQVVSKLRMMKDPTTFSFQ